MTENLSDKLREFLRKTQGRVVELNQLRAELKINPDSPAWDGIRVLMLNLTKTNVVKPSGKKDGVYKVITQVEPVQIFGQKRERRPPFELIFPKDFDKGAEMDFAEYVVIREGDLITIGGVKSKGKTTLCLNYCAENIDKKPVLMGNEYTKLVEDKYEPAQRFLHRLDVMSEWINWVDEEGYDKFTLLPIHDDYAEHIVRDRINIIDWINIDAGQLYDIGKVLEDIKANLGRGIGIVALQKGESSDNPRGGQFVRDFSDLELLLDGFGEGEDDILLTVKGAKEKTKPIVGKIYSYTIGGSGTKILNFREVKKCTACFGKGYTNKGKCDTCFGTKFVDK